MTPELLEKANIISKRIKELKHFRESINSPYICYINSVGFKGSERYDTSMSVKSGSELQTLILDLINRELERLENEFEKL